MLVLKYRPISQFFRMLILPEIERRIAESKITNLPLELHQFRVTQTKSENGEVLNIIEINNEFNLHFGVKIKNIENVKAGEFVDIKKLDIKNAFVKPPIVDGKQCAFFVFQSFFTDFIPLYDFRPNYPEIVKEELEENPIYYPLENLIKMNNFIEEVKPIEKIKKLNLSNWPPAPGYFPETLKHMHLYPKNINEDNFYKAVANSYDRDFWDMRIEFWKEADFFTGRLNYIEKAIKAHFDKEFFISIYTIVPQFEGIIYDYLNDYLNVERINIENMKYKDKIDALYNLFVSRNVLLFSKELFDFIFEYLKEGSFWISSSKIKSEKNQINRHGIVHGVFKGFECEELSLKWLILLDALSHLLLQDKIINGTI